MAIEEMAELIQRINHRRRANKKVSWKKLASEIADVKIMMGQLTVIYGVSVMVAEAEQVKLRKLKRYLEKDGK